MTKKITVLLVDDHSLVRRGFRRMLEDDADMVAPEARQRVLVETGEVGAGDNDALHRHLRAGRRRRVRDVDGQRDAATAAHLVDVPP